MTVWDMLVPVVLVGGVILVSFTRVGRKIGLVLLALIGFRSKQPWDA